VSETDTRAPAQRMADDAEVRHVRGAASHRESPLFGADRCAYWNSLQSLGRVVRINAADPAYAPPRLRIVTFFG
jgi:hypothetical protein